MGTFQSVGVKVLPEVMRRFRAAWPDVQIELLESHLDGDHETRRLRADVTVVKNGHEPVQVVLLGKPRRGG